MKRERDMLPIEEVATLLHTTPLNILMHIKRGRLRGVEEAGAWFVEHASLVTLREQTGGRKAPDVCARGCAGRHACAGDCG